MFLFLSRNDVVHFEYKHHFSLKGYNNFYYFIYGEFHFLPLLMYLGDTIIKTVICIFILA